MKILAYGGNQYSIRTVIGEWPGISSEVLGDLYGIPSGSASFGLVFPGGSPALLYRERINPQYRGGYPYTVLLDLGPWEGADSLWSRAGWNAAGLLECMFGVDSLRRATFMAPERLGVAQLRSIVEEILSSHELDRLAQDAPELPGFEKKWANLLAGSVSSSVPVVAPPKALSLERRPTMAEVASLSFRLPPWIRTGRGWMVGGSYTQAAGFGAAALLDDEPFGEKADPSPAMREGEQLQALLEELSSFPPTARKARELAAVPATQWPDARQFFDQASLLRRAVAGDDSAFQQELPEDGILAAEIFEAAFKNAMDKAGRQVRVGPHQTRAILQSRRRFGPTRISRSLVRFLDADALNQQLDVESAPPNVPDYLELTPEICAARCNSQLDAVKGDLSKVDLENWRRFLRDAGAAEAENDFLKEFAWRQHWLWRWKGEDRKLNEILKQEAAYRLNKGPENYRPTWLFGCLFFLSKDDVNAGLERFKDKLDVPLKDLVLQLQAEPPELGSAARKWLAELASSGLRKNLAVETKLEVAFVNPAGWASLLNLSDALRGNKPYAGKEAAKPEREVLAQECLELLSLYISGNQLRIPEREFRSLAKTLDLEKRYPAELKRLARNRQLLRSGEAPEPDQKIVAIDASPPDRAAVASADLFASASQLSSAIDKFAKATSASGEDFSAGARRRHDPDRYNDLADLLLFRRYGPHSLEAQVEYVRLPIDLAAAGEGVAGLVIAVAAWYLRVHTRPIPFVDALGLAQHPFILGLAALFAILGAVELTRGLSRRFYAVNLSREAWQRLQRSVKNLMQHDSSARRRSEELVARAAQSGLQNAKFGGSFDWLLLLYLGSDEGRLAEFLEEDRARQIVRVHRRIVSALARGRLIERKGWFRG